MNPDEYAAQQAVISAATLNYVRSFGKFFTRPALSVKDWLGMLNILFPEVQRQREQSAALAREFYDFQRAEAVPTLPRNDRPLVGTDFQHFVHHMEPARARMSQVDSPEHAVTQLGLQAVREVENAGRRQIIQAVEQDNDLEALIQEEAAASLPKQDRPKPAAVTPEQPTLVRGWARVATGRETCAWCLMLVSRGPVYHSAEAAGLHLDDQGAQRMIAAGEDVSDNMEQWHPGCDCKVVPVFKEEWSGKAAADRALELWNEATLEADRLIESGQARTNDRNREAINALRRRIDHGDITRSEWSALSAA